MSPERGYRFRSKDMRENKSLKCVAGPKDSRRTLGKSGNYASRNARAAAIFTLPFSFEGKKRKKIALDSLEEIEKKVNTLIVIPNDKLINPNLPKLSVEDAFLKCDEFLKEAVESISNVITATGVLNLDFSDIKEVLKDGGTAFFGIGRSQGKDRAIKAVENALQSPITKISLKKTNGVLFNVASGTQDVLLSEIKKIAEIIKGKSLPNVKIIFGTSFDEKLLKDEIRVTVIATSSEKP